MTKNWFCLRKRKSKTSDDAGDLEQRAHPAGAADVRVRVQPRAPLPEEAAPHAVRHVCLHHRNINGGPAGDRIIQFEPGYR